MSLESEVQGSKGFAKTLLSLIPSGAKLASEAQQAVIRKYGSAPISCKPPNADTILCELLDTEYQLYLQYERKALESLVPTALTPTVQQKYPTVHRAPKSAEHLFSCA